VRCWEVHAAVDVDRLRADLAALGVALSRGAEKAFETASNVGL
jgi:hypothetical protein